jgi:hypothetical protein
MFPLFSHLGADLRRSPFYAALLGLGLAGFVVLGLRGGRLLGDDNETPGTEASGSGAPRTGGHGGYVHGFNHK